MSRFPELFEDAIELVVEREALLVEVLAEHIAASVVERQGALKAEVWIRAQWPIHRRTPVTEPRHAGDGDAVRDRRGVRVGNAPGGGRRGDGDQRLPVRPGARAQPCLGAAARRRLRSSDVERILELVPIATHNQRGRQTLFVGTEQDLDAEVLVDVAERSMSAPIYDLLKRPDELFVVEHAHLQPRFVEDSVRHALRDALETLPQLDDDDFLLSRQVNFETIHVHDVVAERFGTVGELRGELARGSRARRRRRSPPGSAARPVQGAGDAAARSGARCRRRAGGCSRGADAITAIAPATPKSDDRPRVAEPDDEDDERECGRDRREGRKPCDEEDDEPDADADERRERGERQGRAAGGGHHLPALWNRMNTGRAWPSHRSRAREDADSAPPAQRPTRRREPFATSSNATESPASGRRPGRRCSRRRFRCPPCGCPRRARGAAPSTPNGSEPRRYPPRTSERVGQRAATGGIAVRGDPAVHDGPVEVPRNASMYAARSVW